LLLSSSLCRATSCRCAKKKAKSAVRERLFPWTSGLFLGFLPVMTVSMQRVLVSLKLPKTVPALLLVAQRILQAMTDNPHFPSPNPPLKKFAAALADLEDAEATALSRARGTAAARNAKRAALVSLLTRLKAYVQGVADDSPEQARSIIESAGMNVQERVLPPKPSLAVKPAAVSGSVKLIARAVAKEASYEWAFSDDDRKTWKPVPRAMQANTVVSGLTVGEWYSFRFRAATRKGTGDWSEAVAFLVR
jgi:hypothetical protein